MNQLLLTITAYLCRKCDKMHNVGSKAGKAHLAYAPYLWPKGAMKP